MPNLLWDFGSTDQRAIRVHRGLAILSPGFFEAYRQAQVAAIDDIPQERIGLKARIEEVNGSFTYEDPWMQMTLRPKNPHYELEIIGFYKNVSKRSKTALPNITTPKQAIEALKLEVRDYWTAPPHMLPNAPSEILNLFYPCERKYGLTELLD